MVRVVTWVGGKGQEAGDRPRELVAWVLVGGVRHACDGGAQDRPKMDLLVNHKYAHKSSDMICHSVLNGMCISRCYTDSMSILMVLFVKPLVKWKWLCHV